MKPIICAFLFLSSVIATEKEKDLEVLDEKSPLVRKHEVVINVTDEDKDELASLGKRYEHTCEEKLNKCLACGDRFFSGFFHYGGLFTAAVPQFFHPYIPEPYNQIITCVGLFMTFGSGLFSRYAAKLDPDYEVWEHEKLLRTQHMKGLLDKKYQKMGVTLPQKEEDDS